MNRGDAFGVGIDAELDFPGLRPTRRPAVDRARLTLASRQELVAGWPAGSERIATTRRADGRVGGTWSRHPEAGYLLRAEGFGTFVVAADGRSARCAPVRVATWKWQRYLVGQVLPLLAVLHGHEVFHAAVVAKGGRAVALVGASGAGKSSLAAGLVLRGHRYVADDVLALRPGAGLRAEPGVALTSLRWDAADRHDAGELDRLGSPIGEDLEGMRLAVDLVDDAVPLAGLYVLARDADVRGAVFESLRPVDPRLLLAASYNFVVLDRARRLRQLDVCAELATGVPVHRLVVGPDIGPAATADALDRHIERELA